MHVYVQKCMPDGWAGQGGGVFGSKLGLKSVKSVGKGVLGFFKVLYSLVRLGGVNTMGGDTPRTISVSSAIVSCKCKLRETIADETEIVLGVGDTQLELISCDNITLLPTAEQKSRGGSHYCN